MVELRTLLEDLGDDGDAALDDSLIEEPLADEVRPSAN